MARRDAALSRSQAATLDALGISRWDRRMDSSSVPLVAADADPAETVLQPPAAVLSAAGTGGEWQALRSEVAACTRCALHAGRKQTVFGVGDRRARWLIIGEAPGADEDEQGEPFVGRAGQLLNEMLLAAGAGRDQVFIANILKCRPPANRDPKPDESEACEPFLQRQIGLLRPQLILAVGRIAAQNLLREDTPIGKLRGRVHTYAPTGTPLVVTYHPAYLLRSPSQKRKSWDDLCLARSVVVPVVR